MSPLAVWFFPWAGLSPCSTSNSLSPMQIYYLSFSSLVPCTFDRASYFYVSTHQCPWRVRCGSSSSGSLFLASDFQSITGSSFHPHVVFIEPVGVIGVIGFCHVASWLIICSDAKIIRNLLIFVESFHEVIIFAPHIFCHSDYACSSCPLWVFHSIFLSALKPFAASFQTTRVLFEFGLSGTLDILYVRWATWCPFQVASSPALYYPPLLLAFPLILSTLSVEKIFLLHIFPLHDQGLWQIVSFFAGLLPIGLWLWLDW